MIDTWIIFKIDGKQVYQIRYNGCTGKDLIDDCKTMIAGEYKVLESEIKIQFGDELVMTKEIGLVNPEVLKELCLDAMIEMRN